MMFFETHNLVAFMTTDHNENCITLRVECVGLPVDRTDVAAWSFDNTPRGQTLCYRLKRCIEAGKAFVGYGISTDIYGKTYVAAHMNGFFHKRHMSRELRRLGF